MSPEQTVAGVPRVLVVEDDADYASLLCGALGRSLAVEVVWADTIRGARQAWRERSVAAVLLDARLPDGDGLGLVRALRREGTEVPFVMLTADESAAGALRALREGAHDYVIKGRDDLERASAGLRFLLGGDQDRMSRDQMGLLGNSFPMRALRAEIERYGRTTAPVLIEGETGVGKELVARALHRASGRGRGPFVAVNCGGFPESLAETEFFGHVRGAYTGAGGDRAGLVAHAAGGTLFLDEVEDLPSSVQGKLLRLIQEGEYRAVGSVQVRRSDIRILAASNRDLRRMVAQGDFRADLLYRLEVLSLQVPPLRERLGDLSVLIAHFLEGENASEGRPNAFEVSRLEAHSWPGNVRELQSCVERARAIANGMGWRRGWQGALAKLSRVPPSIGAIGATVKPGGGGNGRGVVQSGRAFSEPPEGWRGGGEGEEVFVALERHRWRRDAAARALGISRATLWRRMRRYGFLESAS